MNRKIALLMLIMFLISTMIFSGCGSSKKELNGNYILVDIEIEGVHLGSKGFYPSMITVGKENNNIGVLFSLYWEDRQETDTTFGYADLVSEDGNLEKYKVYVYDFDGSFFSEMDYYYLYHYTDKDTIVVEATGDITFTFEKQK